MTDFQVGERLVRNGVEQGSESTLAEGERVTVALNQRSGDACIKVRTDNGREVTLKAIKFSRIGLQLPGEEQ